MRPDRLFAAVVTAVFLLAAPAAALVGDTDGAFGLDGTLRTTAFGLRNYDNPNFFGPSNKYDGLSQSSLRLIAAGSPADWISFQIHGLQELRFTSTPVLAGQPPPLMVPVRRYRVFQDQYNWADEPDTVASISPEWYNFTLSVGPLDITIGRQAITLGKAYLWNPLDVFSPFDPQQFDRDYKPGADAARVTFSIGEFSGVEVIGAGGREILDVPLYKDTGRSGCDWYGSAVLGRAYTTVKGIDISLQGGKVYGGTMLGGGAVSEIGLGIQVRGEAAYIWTLDPRPLPAPLPPEDFVPDSLQAVLSIGRKWENSLDVEAEYYFNGAGETENNLAVGRFRQLTGGTQQWGRNYAGLTASYEFLPILTGRIVGILSMTDRAGLIQPFFTWSLSDESDVGFGAVAALGRRPTNPPVGGPTPPMLRSEYGSYSSSFFVQFKTYF